MQCAKCRQVTYCNLNCQKAHWDAHKRECKPTFAFTMTKLLQDHAAGNWEKVMKYRGDLEQILHITGNMVGDEMTMHKDRIRILAMFVDAHKKNMVQMNIQNEKRRLGNEALELCYVLEQCVLSQVKIEDYEGAGLSMCDMASFAQIVPVDKIPLGNDTFLVERNFEAAALLGRTHGIFSVVAQACLGLGNLAWDNQEIDTAERLFKEAFVAAAKIQHTERETQICLSLADIYFVKGNVDRADWFVNRTSRLLEQDQYGLYKTFTSMHLANQLQKIRIHEKNGEMLHVNSGLSKFVTLVHSNLADVARWRMILQTIILHCFGHLWALDQSTGNPLLKAMMNALADFTGIPIYRLYLPTHKQLPRIKYGECGG